MFDLNTTVVEEKTLTPISEDDNANTIRMMRICDQITSSIKNDEVDVVGLTLYCGGIKRANLYIDFFVSYRSIKTIQVPLCEQETEEVKEVIRDLGGLLAASVAAIDEKINLIWQEKLLKINEYDFFGATLRKGIVWTGRRFNQ